MSTPEFHGGESIPSSEFWEGLDLPNPGCPPQADPWWRRQTPATIVAKAEDRVRWGWTNYVRYLKIATQANVRTGTIKTMEEGLTTQHSRCLEGLQQAMAEESPMGRKTSRDTAKIVAGKAIRFQKQSKRFTDSVLNEVHARAAGLPRYPSPDALHAASMSGGLPNTQAPRRDTPLREGRYCLRRPPSLDGIRETYQMDDQANIY